MFCCFVVDIDVMRASATDTSWFCAPEAHFAFARKNIWNSCAKKKSETATDGVEMPESTTRDALRSVVTADDFDDSFEDLADDLSDKQVVVF